MADPTPYPTPSGEGSLTTAYGRQRSAPLSRRIPRIKRRRVGGGVRRGALPLLLFLLTSLTTQAQRLLDFSYADSLTQTLFDQQRWVALDSVGRQARALGTDYPALRRRLGAGALATGRVAEALRQYGSALRANPLDTAARTGLVAAYLAFHQPAPAALLAAGLPDSLRRQLHLRGRQAITYLELTGSTLQTNEHRRGAAAYGRLGVGSRLSPRLSLDQSLSYYRQDIELARHNYPGQADDHVIDQTQYHALLAAQLAPRWQVKAGYNFLSKDLGSNHLGYLALVYARPLYVVQGGVYAGTLSDTARVQADLRLTVYPLGQPGLYGFGRGSVVASGGVGYANFLLGAGGRLRPWLWVEGWGSAGRVPVLAEADGTYVYNLFDTLRRRASVSVLILGPQQLSLRLTGVAEERLLANYYSPSTYTLYSLTASLAWTW